MQKFHTILGAGGAIGLPLANLLISQGLPVRLASRKAAPFFTAESIACDLLSFQDTLHAVQGSDVVYLLAGLQYNYSVWQAQWPVIMNNCIRACKETGAKLVFFDNVYMYGKVDGKMTETTPYNPCSKKGEVRAKIARMLEDEMRSGALKALIARSADFYGPNTAKTSILSILLLDKLFHGKKPQWSGNATVPHSLTYTPDAAKGVQLLAATDSAFGQIWHLPTMNPALTGEGYTQLAADILQTSAKPMVIKTWMMKALGMFDQTVKELAEMQYQFDYPYYFDSTKFEKAFNFTPTSYRDGMIEAINFLRQ